MNIRVVRHNYVVRFGVGGAGVLGLSRRVDYVDDVVNSLEVLNETMDLEQWQGRALRKPIQLCWQLAQRRNAL